MPKILITGNGFDLFHHLPTKYQHFMSVMKTIESKQVKEEVAFEHLFGHNFKIDSNYDYDVLSDNYMVENIHFNYDKINRIKEMLEANLWYKYFSEVLEINSWIDFETEVESVLNQLTYFMKFNDKWEMKENRFSDVYIQFNDFALFNMIQILNTQGGFKINEKYIDIKKSSVSIEGIIKDLSKSFEDFIKIFNRYLMDIVTEFYSEIKSKPSIPFYLMDKIYTFNYTPTFESVYEIDNTVIVYLHGKINEDCLKQNLVLGVSEIADHIKLDKGYDFTKYYQKIIKKSNKKFIEIPLKDKGYDKETIFYIIGHSLDKSDKEYIMDLFNFLEADSLNKSRICVFYYNDKDRDSKVRNLLSIVEEKIISKMNREGRLEFVELNESNLNMEFNKI